MASFRLSSLRQACVVILPLGLVLLTEGISSAQMMPPRPILRGVPQTAMLPANLPGKPLIPLLNNGTLQVTAATNPAQPNTVPFIYIAFGSLGDRLALYNPVNIQALDPGLYPGVLTAGGMNGQNGNPGGNPGGGPGGGPIGGNFFRRGGGGYTPVSAYMNGYSGYGSYGGGGYGYGGYGYNPYSSYYRGYQGYGNFGGAPSAPAWNYGATFTGMDGF
jgi:hypothetical protein